MKIFNKYSLLLVSALLLPCMLSSCDSGNMPDLQDDTVPEGMVEIQPVLPGMFSSIPRKANDNQTPATRAYDSNETTDGYLTDNKLLRLPEGATVWLIVKSEGQATATLMKKSYMVYNPEDDPNMSYLLPCTVNDEGEMLTTEGAPLYLKEDQTYEFFAISPARKLNETDFANGKVGFQVKNGEYFYANDCRYSNTEPNKVTVQGNNKEGVQVVKLKPMINQTAELRFQIKKGEGVHDLDIQPTGIQISGLQNDSPDATDSEGNPNPYGNPDGLFWHMSLTGDEPIGLQHGDKAGIFNCYTFEKDTQGRINIRVPVLPMWSISKPVIVIFRLKINGVPTTYEMMLNEKDFKAGYSYGYRGEVSISEGISVITWQFISWEYDLGITVN